VSNSRQPNKQPNQKPTSTFKNPEISTQEDQEKFFYFKSFSAFQKTKEESFSQSLKLSLFSRRMIFCVINQCWKNLPV